jgi:nitrite reductase (NO-forming)
MTMISWCLHKHDYDAASRGNLSNVLFNGFKNALVGKLYVTRVHIFVGNAWPDLISSFHIIGIVFDRTYFKEVILPWHPSKCIGATKLLQRTLILTDGTAVIQLKMQISGNFVIANHSINCIKQGKAGFMIIKGKTGPRMRAKAPMHLVQHARCISRLHCHPY